MSDVSDAPEPVEIAPSWLSPLALTRLIEAFITREGTDYGEREVSLAEKVAEVREQLRLGEAVIMFDPATESTTLVLKDRHK